MDSVVCVAVPAQLLPMQAPWKEQATQSGRADSKIFLQKKASPPPLF